MIATLALIALLPTAANWTPLFDGKTLDGWTQLGGKATYKVQNGEIVGSTVVGTPNSFLCTDKIYGDFELEFEVWVNPTVNSGVQIRSNSAPGFKNGAVHGYQVEIDPSKRAWSGGIYDESRRGWLQDLSNKPDAQAAFKNNQWNKYRVVAKGDHLQTWVNGKAVADLRDKVTRTGFIGLQVHSHDKDGVEVKWRKLRIKDNGTPDSKPPRGGKWLLQNEGDLKNWTSARNPGQPCPWNWVDGAMQVTSGGGDVMTRDQFTDATFYLEFMTDENGRQGQANGNSGVYMVRSYELQILNSAPRGPADNECGGIYTIKAPDYAMAKPANEWQTYLIYYTAPKWNGSEKAANARATIYHNGTLIHDNIELPHPTGGGMAESPDPRPFLLQDHGNKIRFRNVWTVGSKR